MTNRRNEIAAGFWDEPIGVSTEIAPDDEMYASDPQYYFEAGTSAVRAIRAAMLIVGKPAVGEILDLPCGHGRVLRTLAVAFPAARLTACDIHRPGVDFCAERFGARPVYSTEDPSEIPLNGDFDLIWCGSLLTHLDEPMWDGFLELFESRLKRNGLLVFTAHGRNIVGRLRRGDFRDAIDPTRGKRLLRAYDDTGFGYTDYSGQSGYGVSLSAPSWVCDRIERSETLRLVAYTERAWLGHDVVACVRRLEAESP